MWQENLVPEKIKESLKEAMVLQLNLTQKERDDPRREDTPVTGDSSHNGQEEEELGRSRAQAALCAQSWHLPCVWVCFPLNTR